LTVTPSKNLKSGETVRVTGTGFKKGDSVYVVECLIGAKGGAQCNELGATPATISSKGLLPLTRFKVTTEVSVQALWNEALESQEVRRQCRKRAGTDSAVFPIIFK